MLLFDKKLTNPKHKRAGTLTTPYSDYSPKQTTKNAATTVINDLLSWLKETLLRGAKYIPVKSGKWLKAKAGEYSWAEPSQVPRKAKQNYGQLNEENDDSDSSQSTSGESATWDVDSETRKTRLKKANSLQAARLLSDNSRMLATAKAEPSVVDCDTAVGVELKAAAYSGNLDSVAGKYDVSPSQVGDIIGTELAARAGYNTFGDSLPGEIGNAEADADTDTGTGSGDGAGDGSGEGNGANPQSGRPSPGTDTSHIPTTGNSNSGSSSGGRPSPGSKGSHIPTSGSSASSSSSGSSSSRGSATNGGSTSTGPGASSGSNGVGASSSGSTSSSPGASGSSAGAGSSGSSGTGSN